MASAQESVIFHTVPSTYVSSFNKSLDVPYRRVVGFQGGEYTEILWADEQFHNEVASYERSQAAEEEFTVPLNVANKIGSFYARFFAELQKPDTGFIKKEDIRPRYNCHRFGYWMRGIAVASAVEVPEEPTHIVEMGRVAHSPLKSGVHGVIGLRDDGRQQGCAIHSIVGLGEDKADCLQVLASGGFMGLDKYQNVLDFYRALPSSQGYQPKIYY